MALTVAEMTKEELRELIEISIEQKLLEIFGDPEEELELKEAVQKQLQNQKASVASGERGRILESADYFKNVLACREPGKHQTPKS